MSTTPGITIDKDGNKWVTPLENNPEVFEELSRQLGVSPTATFRDVWTLDESEFGEPVHALLATVQAPAYYRARENEPKLAYDGSGPDEPVMWFNQTVRNTCGLMSFLHALSNGPARKFVPEDSQLRKEIFDKAEPLGPEARAKVIYDSDDFLLKAHGEAARLGQSANPGNEGFTPHHFITFLKGDDGHLWELEGGWGGPIDRGELGPDEGVLSERALDAGIRRFMKVAEGNDAFSIVALTDPKKD